MSVSRKWLLGLCALVFTPGLWAASGHSLAPINELLQGREPQTQGLILDLPLISEDGSAVPLELSFEGALSADDRLQAIYIFAGANPNPEVIEFHLHSAQALPRVATRIRLNESQTVWAVAISEQGHTWIAQREVRVTVSGCLMRGDDAATAGMHNPRIGVPRRMTAGQPLELRTLINHPMETGLRENAAGELVPKDLVTHLAVELDGEPAFTARFHTGTSANPYVLFNVKLEQPREAEFVWTDQHGQTVSETRQLL